MIEDRLSDLLDGVSVLVVLVLALFVMIWIYLHKILKALRNQSGDPHPKDRNS